MQKKPQIYYKFLFEHYYYANARQNFLIIVAIINFF